MQIQWQQKNAYQNINNRLVTLLFSSKLDDLNRARDTFEQEKRQKAEERQRQETQNEEQRFYDLNRKAILQLINRMEIEEKVKNNTFTLSGWDLLEELPRYNYLNDLLDYFNEQNRTKVLSFFKRLEELRVLEYKTDDFQAGDVPPEWHYAQHRLASLAGNILDPNTQTF